jgi:hypothetical protein
MSIQYHGTHSIGHRAMAASVAALWLLSPVPAAADEASADPQAAWREAISQSPAPSRDGCFRADYPFLHWVEVACVAAPQRPYLPTTGTGRGETVGRGHDYVANSTHLIADAKGSFPSATTTGEQSGGLRNIYSLQLNSDLMDTPACLGHPNCKAWQQFIYSSRGRAAFMQYWLLGWDATCPAGWNTSGSDCWKNSGAANVPRNAIQSLSKMSLFGSALTGGKDKLTFTGPSHAYSIVARDNVLFLASAWHQAEFNVLGDGHGTEAFFDAGTQLTVRTLVHHGAIGVIDCSADFATTRETNNLDLGTCTVTHGSDPYITVLESN